MRIVFLCTSLEPGRDGVGDYTLRLSEELLQLGNDVAIVALHDRHISDEQRVADRDGIRLIRLPSNISWRDRTRIVRDFLDSYGPDWISLQVVPYGFSDKGMDLKFGERVRDIVGKRRLHVMFHEIWIGAYKGARMKERLVGMIQRECIRRLVRCTKPAVVSTSNEAYAALLREAGVDASVLPLFGNVPFASGPQSDWLATTLQSARVTGGREAHWIFVFFGTLHPIWTPEPLFSYLSEAAAMSGKKITIVSIGRIGPGESLWNRLCDEYGRAFQFFRLGEEPVDHISEVLAEADFGIATSPWQLIGKSGTAASMLEHGLPVIVSRDDVNFPSTKETEPVSDLLIKMDASLPTRLASARRQAPKPVLPDVARLLLRHLDGARLSS